MIQDILTSNEVVSLLETMDIRHDKVENIFYVYYPNVEIINGKTNFITFLKDRRVITIAGFIANKWLFFDEIVISCNGEPIFYYFDNLNIQRDVLSNGQISEKVDMTHKLDDEDIHKIANADDVIIRFKSGETDEYIDFELTNEEKNALVIMNDLRDTYVALSSLAYAVYNEYYR